MPTFSFNVAEWKRVRPKEAEGSGVAAAIKAFVNVVQKDVGAMNTAEVAKARKATEAVVSAFDLGLSKIKKNDMPAQKAKTSIATWKTECAVYLQELQNRDRAILVEPVQREYEKLYQAARDNVLAAHAAAKQAAAAVQAGGPMPENKFTLNWATVARNSLKMCTKTHIKEIGGIGMERIKVEELYLPRDLKDTKTKIDEINTYLTFFAKEAKRTTRTSKDALDDTKAVEKELKGILVEFDKVDALMKPLIKRSTDLANQAKATTDAIKKLSTTPGNQAAFAPHIAKLKLLRAELDKQEAQMRAANHTYRERDGKLAKRRDEWKKMPGYEAKYGDIVLKRQEACFMGVRRVSVPVTEGKRQVDRAKDILARTPAHRNLASQL